MSNVISFPGRAKAEPQATEQKQPEAPQGNDQALKEMFKTSAAMNLIATLSFYAAQGYDGGKKAREAMPSLAELMATKGIQLVVPA